VFVLRDLDRLEVVCSRDVRHFSQSRGVLFAGRPCRLVILATQDGEVGGPPSLKVVGRA